MKLKILSWNVRGANDRNKRKVIKALIRSQKVDLVCLQETKIQEMSQGVIHSLGVGRFLGWGAVDARGAAGGVVVFWDKRVLELVAWKWESSQSRVDLRIARMGLCGSSQGSTDLL